MDLAEDAGVDASAYREENWRQGRNSLGVSPSGDSTQKLGICAFL
jgi:hypothetical protein